MKCVSCGFENPAGMRFCGACGTLLQGTVLPARSVDSRGGAHRRHMTVMFCDIVGSTPMSQTLDPEDFRDVLSEFHYACARAIERFNGHIARYSGDGLVVYFGYPRAREDSPQEAVHAGLGILDELELLGVDLRNRHSISLRVRIGIHTGVVVAGEMGAGATRDQMAIVGDTPHIAARLESIAKPGTVVISDTTRDLTEGYFETESLGETELKGVSRAGEAVPLLADLLEIEGRDGDARSALSPRDARTAMLQILEALLVVDPARHPLLLIIEDVHWVDPTTVELLGRIIVNLPQRPALCVLTFRPEFTAPWTEPAPIEVELRPLSSDGVRALAARASPKSLDPAVLEWVQSAADGIPLFVEETLKMFEHAGDVDLVGSGGAGSVVPSTLQGLLTERLDRLPDLVDLIDVAAVLGREFDRGLLEALWPPEAPDLEPALLQLAAHDVLRPVVGTPSRCEFSHALLQEAAYERILRRHRQTLHGRVASSLIGSSLAAAEREPEVVAHHWSCAAQPAKAVRYWHAAGTRALERAAFLEASHHFRRGLEALDEVGPDPGDDLERADFLTHRAASLQAVHGYAAAGVDEAYAKARSSCERAGSQDRLIPVIRGEWLFHLLRSEYGIARELADEMLALGQSSGNPALLAGRVSEAPQAPSRGCGDPKAREEKEVLVADIPWPVASVLS
jgi:class 3 adenylate cyclase